ncbi:orotidine-5'-phosphate decarboxylase [Terriglobus saanensis]|uniref:Orotidine 5'-phosphate decarboxylase n=1 Tax=Terriglobus saanensis (strain ATCC BAA-1853 / DSM 23119 / SP1PR4) TaxID=401053 RepID=E8V6K9_TERSS|nr:orotidine-5'-phosphate decarboxylase [Terriglobus saanensis]ADV82748.1 orotidine 5'-phosphate decarboxylase [Terriglobus saanensis SP1PR4]
MTSTENLLPNPAAGEPTRPRLSAEEAAKQRLIVALDFPSGTEALAMAARLQGSCTWMKVGLELYLAAGQKIVDDLKHLGFDIFLDLKLHDIPNTVAGAVRSVASSGASLLTLHASGGPAMLSAAAEAASTIQDAPRLLAVTVLTSMNEQELLATGISASPGDRVLQLGAMAMKAGVAGLVCSPLETASLRGALGTSPLLVVPGIRSATDAKGDQSRTASPAEAIASGASMLVVGRPITTAADPAEAAAQILQKIRP